MICIEIADSGECIRIEREVWITTNRNGLIRTPHRIKARGVGDGHRIWSLGELQECPMARIITLSQYEEKLAPGEEDPELSAEEALNIILGGNHESE